jgi:cyclohexadieny/prephenate dehydrogenase
MVPVVRQLAIIGQGLIGSSIARAVHERGVARQIVATDASPKVRERVIELGIGGSKVVSTSAAAVEGADMVIACVPVGQIGSVAREIKDHLQPGAIFSDVGSVKASVVGSVQSHIPSHAHFIPAHPLAGTERSGPENGLANLFANRWCILTPPDDADPAAVERVKTFWEALGAQVELMTATHHDNVLAITSHLPHLIAFTIFHTALRHEDMTNSEVIKFSAGGFRDFTRIASSNPTMWRDIFLNNKTAVLEMLKQFNADLAALADAIEHEDGLKLVESFSKSRLTRRKVIEKEHISVSQAPRPEVQDEKILVRPYSSND